MTVSVATRLRDRHGISLLGVLTHIGFFLLVLASALTLMDHRPQVVNIQAEKNIVLSSDEVVMLVGGLQLIECETQATYRVSFQWLRAELASAVFNPNAKAPEILDTGIEFLDPEAAKSNEPTHVKMLTQAMCEGQEPVERSIGPMLIRR